MSHDLATQTQATQPTAMELLHMAVAGGAQIDTIERLAKLQQQMFEREAEREFNDAMSRCQAQMKRIAADMENPQTRSKYASFAQIDRAIRPIYTAEGLSLSFSDGDPTTAEYLTIICYVSRGGYTRMYRKGMPVVTVGPQGKAVMTPTHATGSAGSYAKRYLIKDIFNLALGQDDDDGNGGIHDSNIRDYSDAINAATDRDELKRIWEKADAFAVSIKDVRLRKHFADLKDAKKVSL